MKVEQLFLFADLLEGSGILDSAGEVLRPASVVDHDLCYAFYFDDPWGNKFELDCYDHARTKAELVEPRAITPNRFW